MPLCVLQRPRVVSQGTCRLTLIRPRAAVNDGRSASKSSPWIARRSPSDDAKPRRERQEVSGGPVAILVGIYRRAGFLPCRSQNVGLRRTAGHRASARAGGEEPGRSAAASSIVSGPQRAAARTRARRGCASVLAEVFERVADISEERLPITAAAVAPLSVVRKPSTQSSSASRSSRCSGHGCSPPPAEVSAAPSSLATSRHGGAADMRSPYCLGCTDSAELVPKTSFER